LQQQIGSKGAHHVLGAVAEIDDVEHAENDGQSQAQQRVKRTVDQADQQLPEQRLRRDAEDFKHANVPLAEKGAGQSPPLVLSRSAVDQRATAILRIAESILGRNGGLELVEVARVLRFGRRLDLEEESVMPLASGRIDVAFAEQRIV